MGAQAHQVLVDVQSELADKKKAAVFPASLRRSSASDCRQEETIFSNEIE
jgi:hypothetical protein